jgi:hypothetical protein
MSKNRIVGQIVIAASIALGLAASPAGATTSPASPSGPTMTAKKKVKPGVIYIHTKRFTSCSSWGKDKNWCKDNAQ